MSRERFLARIREATGRDPKAPVSLPPPPPAPSVEKDAAAMVERLRLEQEAVLGRVHVVGSAGEACETLRTVLDGARSYIRSPHALLDEVGLEGVAVDLGMVLASAENAEVGVTGCELAVAATGSVGLSSSWGRLAALLPPHHVVVLSADQLVWDINDAYALLARSELPGAWGMHTGPSRSADIEQTMALGVHGPGRVDVIVLLSGAAVGD